MPIKPYQALPFVVVLANAACDGKTSGNEGWYTDSGGYPTGASTGTGTGAATGTGTGATTGTGTGATTGTGTGAATGTTTGTGTGATTGTGTGTGSYYTGNTGWYDTIDNDGDGYFLDGYGYQDCDDNDASVNPGATEDCSDGIDNDCDGQIDANDLDCVMSTAPDRRLDWNHLPWAQPEPTPRTRGLRRLGAWITTE